MCKNRPCTCQRAICECDAGLARRHEYAKKDFDRDYHTELSTKSTGWDPALSCQKSSVPRIPSQPSCIAPIVDVQYGGNIYEVYEQNHDYSSKLALQYVLIYSRTL